VAGAPCLCDGSRVAATTRMITTMTPRCRATPWSARLQSVNVSAGSRQALIRRGRTYWLCPTAASPLMPRAALLALDQWSASAASGCPPGQQGHPARGASGAKRGWPIDHAQVLRDVHGTVGTGTTDDHRCSRGAYRAEGFGTPDQAEFPHEERQTGDGLVATLATKAGSSSRQAALRPRTRGERQTR